MHELLYFIPEPQTDVERYLSIHMILMYISYLLIYILYNAHGKIESCMTAFCAKCRGDGLYNDYDSEVEEEELRQMDENCNHCIERDKKDVVRREQVRKLIGLQFKDNNKLDSTVKEEAKPPFGEKEERYPESSDDDD